MVQTQLDLNEVHLNINETMEGLRSLVLKILEAHKRRLRHLIVVIRMSK